MKKPALFQVALLMCAPLFFAGGCAVYTEPPAAIVGTEIDVDAEPPPPLVEEVSPSPGIGFVWIGGSWAWHDHWVWEKGRWDRPPHPGAVWVPHRYVSQNGRHIFIRGGWR